MKVLITFIIVCFAGTRAQVAPLVSGGENTEIEDAPYMLSLRLNGRHICSAVAISSRWAITSAQCVIDPVQTLSIQAGSSFNDCCGSIHSIIEMEMHHMPRTYDLALIMVTQPFGENVIPITLATSGTDPQAGALGRISGWGAKNEGDPHSNILQSGTVAIVNRRYCKKEFDLSIICAARFEVNICDGDKGSPIVVGGVLVGMASWTFNCADPFQPGVYGNIGAYNVRSWISDITGI